MSSGAGIDLGRTTVRLAEIQTRKGSFVMKQYVAAEVEAGETTAAAAGEVFGRLKSKPPPARVGVTGADVMMRYLPVPEVEDWRLERLMEFEVRELEGKSGSPLATSFNILPVPKELDEEDTILLGLIRESLLEEWIDEMQGVAVQAFTPNAVALYNCFLALGDHEPAVTLLANIGAGTLDLALVRGTELYFARSVTTGLEKRDKMLADRLGIDEARAERLVRKHLDLKAAADGTLTAEADRVTRPVLPLYDALPTLLSGVVTLCKAQARLRDLTLDRVLLTAAARWRAASTPTSPTAWACRSWCGTRWRWWSWTTFRKSSRRTPSWTGRAPRWPWALALSAADPDLYALEILPPGGAQEARLQGARPVRGGRRRHGADLPGRRLRDHRGPRRRGRRLGRGAWKRR